MIAFDLECSQGHIFEGWFDSLESFEEQKIKSLVSCPYCDDSNIRKVLSPVAVKKSPPVPTNPARQKSITTGLQKKWWNTSKAIPKM